VFIFAFVVENFFIDSSPEIFGYTLVSRA